MQLVLYQFPVSHYCEKARWALDWNGLSYRIRNQVPGLHARVNRRRTGSATVPVLVDGGRAISGSHAIALYAESIGSGPRLLPQAPAARVACDEWVQYFDAIVGPAVRQFAYRVLTSRPALFREVMYRDYAGVARLVGLAMSPIARQRIAEMYDVQSASAASVPDVIRAAADRVESALSGGAPFLVGDFSLADLTGASILAPIVGPESCPWPSDFGVPEFRALREELRGRRVGAYVVQVYEKRRRLVPHGKF